MTVATAVLSMQSAAECLVFFKGAVRLLQITESAAETFTGSSSKLTHKHSGYRASGQNTEN